MKNNFISNNVTRNFLGVFLSLFILSSILTTPWVIKVSFYTLTLMGLVSFIGFRKAIIENFANYYPYLVFTFICTLSYLFLQDNNLEMSESPQIENIISLFILFVFLVAWNVRYIEIMNILVLTTSIFLLISLPVHSRSQFLLLYCSYLTFVVTFVCGVCFCLVVQPGRFLLKSSALKRQIFFFCFTVTNHFEIHRTVAILLNDLYFF